MKKSILALGFMITLGSLSFSQKAETLRSFKKQDMDVFEHQNGDYVGDGPDLPRGPAYLSFLMIMQLQ